MSEKPSALSGVANALSGMPPALQRTIVVVLIILVGGIAGWIGRGALTWPSADAATITVYKSWQVVCPGISEKSKDKDKAKDLHCEMVSDIVDAKSGQRMGRMTIGLEKDKTEPTLFILAPLTVLLEPGVALRLDSELGKPVPYKTCTPDGCIAMVPFDEKLAEQFEEASDGAMVVAAPGEEKTVDVAISLKGFKQAWSAYNDGEAKLKSWFWRLWL